MIAAIIEIIMYLFTALIFGGIITGIGYGSSYIFNLSREHFTILLISLLFVGFGTWFYVAEWKIRRVVKRFNAKCRRCGHVFKPNNFRWLAAGNIIGTFNNLEGNIAIFQVYLKMPIYEKCPNCKKKGWHSIVKTGEVL